MPGKSLSYLCNFSVNLKLFQNKKIKNKNLCSSCLGAEIVNIWTCLGKLVSMAWGAHPLFKHSGTQKASCIFYQPLSQLPTWFSESAVFPSLRGLPHHSFIFLFNNCFLSISYKSDFVVFLNYKNEQNTDSTIIKTECAVLSLFSHVWLFANSMDCFSH